MKALLLVGISVMGSVGLATELAVDFSTPFSAGPGPSLYLREVSPAAPSGQVAPPTLSASGAPWSGAASENLTGVPAQNFVVIRDASQSKLIIKAPAPGVDYKLIIKTPDSTVDYKLHVREIPAADANK